MTCFIYRRLSTLFCIFLTLPIIDIAGAERSFSRVIKSFVRSSVGEDLFNLDCCSRKTSSEVEYSITKSSVTLVERTYTKKADVG